MKKSQRTELLIVLVVLIIGFTFRLWRLTSRYDVTQGDVARDYLVARHIIVFHEYVGLGPPNSVFDDLRNSPFYYYFLATPLLIKDSIYTLGVFGVLLQIITIVSAWWFTRTIFGRAAAFICFFLYVASAQFITHTEFMWQPFAAHTLFNTSYALLALGYVKKQYSVVFLSAILYVFGLGIGFYGIPAIPVFVALLICVLLSVRAKTSQFVAIFLSMASIGAIFYVPVLVAYGSSVNGSWFIANSGFAQTLPQHVANISRVAFVLFGTFLNYWESPEWIKYIVPWILIFLTAVAFVVAPRQKKRYMMWIIFFILQPVLATLLIKGNIYDHYFTVVIGPLIAIVSYSFVALFRVNFGVRIVSIVAMLFVVILTLPDKKYAAYVFKGNSDISKIHQESVQWVFDELNNLQNRRGYSWRENTNIIVYTQRNGLTASDSIYWAPLEHMSGSRLVRITNYYYNNYIPIGNDPLVVLVCMDYTSETDRNRSCEQDFIRKNPEYHPEESVYSRDWYYIQLYTKGRQTE